MSRRTLDMMPLLDVFMVVLFVFATIQEGKLSATTEQSEALQEALEQATARVAELEQAQPDPADVESTHAQLAEQQQKSQQLSEALEAERKRLEALQDEARESKEKLEDVSQKLQDQLEVAFASEDKVRQAEVLEKLLDQHSVFEIEIRGTTDPQQGIINTCCYRDDPRSTQWRSCGQVPLTAEAQREWFRQGAGGLQRTLRATKGGNAMTIIRHDAIASHRIGQKIEALVREEVPEQKVYNEGIAVIEMACTP